MPVKHRWLLAVKRYDDFGIGKIKVRMSSCTHRQHFFKLVFSSYVRDSGELMSCCSLHVENEAEIHAWC